MDVYHAWEITDGLRDVDLTVGRKKKNGKTGNEEGKSDEAEELFYLKT